MLPKNIEPRKHVLWLQITAIMLSGVFWLFGLVLNELWKKGPAKKILKFTFRTLAASVGISGVHVGRFFRSPEDPHISVHSRYSPPGWIFRAGGTRGNRNQGERGLLLPKKSPHRVFTHVPVCFREKGPIRLTGCWTDEASILLSGHMALHKQAVKNY